MFQLDQQFLKDTLIVGEFPLSSLLLMNDAHYPWFILVPRREGVTEIFQLNTADRVALMEESCWLSELLMRQYAADKMNVAALGNVVRQLHLHHVVRFQGDAAWPGPVWGRVPVQPCTDEELAQRLAVVRTALLARGDFSFAEVQ
ncbi:MAG: HIT domain-containing protein [Pseudomonas sp.]